MIEAFILTQVNEFNFNYVDLMSIMINVTNVNIMKFIYMNVHL
jgi:hypothetical protein